MKRKVRKLFFICSAAVCLGSLTGCRITEQFEVLKTEILKNDVTLENSQKQATEVMFASEETDSYQTEIPVETEFVTEMNEPTEMNEDMAQVPNYAYLYLSEEEKQVYHEVLNTVLEHAEKAEVSTLDTQVLERAYKAVCADYGGLFWMSGYVYTQYTRDRKLTGMDFAPKYTMEFQERQMIQQQIDASVEELLAGISITDSDYDKAKYIFEILTQNVDYDASVENNQNIISAFLNRATVCQGYASAAQYLLRLLGIESVIVTGRANGESHAWNLIKLDGEYYYMDVTWGNSRYLDRSSQTEKHVNYSYLAMTTDEIKETHTFDNHFPLPECNSISCNYFVRENRYFSEWNPEQIGGLLARVWNDGGEELALKFSSPDIYDMALDYFITQQHISDYCENISSVYYLENKEHCVLTFHFSSL